MELRKKGFSKYKFNSELTQRNSQQFYSDKTLKSAPQFHFEYSNEICMTWRIQWEKWRIQVKLAIIARENIKLDGLLQPKPKTLRLHVEPKYKLAIKDATKYTERDRKIRNNQLKLQWELKCQKITKAGFSFGERPWHLCDQKCVSLLYLSIGTEGRRLLTQKFPHDNIYDLTTLKLWEMMETVFIRPRDITFDRYVFRVKL